MNWDNVEMIRSAQASARERFEYSQLSTTAEIAAAVETETAKQLGTPRLSELEQMIFKMRAELIDYIVAHGLVDGLIWDGVLQPVQGGKIVVTGDMLESIITKLGFFDEAQVQAFLQKYLPAEHYVQDVGYVHTDNNYTDTEKSKLAGIEDGAEINKVVDVLFNGSTVLDNGTRVATINITPEDIKTWYESNTNTNVFTDAEKAKLAGIADGAEKNRVEDVLVDGRSVLNDNKQAIITAKIIKDSYESNVNTNVFTDAEKTQLAANTKNIKTNAEQIATNETDIAANTKAIEANTADITALENELEAASATIVELQQDELRHHVFNVPDGIFVFTAEDVQKFAAVKLSLPIVAKKGTSTTKANFTFIGYRYLYNASSDAYLGRVFASLTSADYIGDYTNGPVLTHCRLTAYTNAKNTQTFEMDYLSCDGLTISEVGTPTWDIIEDDFASASYVESMATDLAKVQAAVDEADTTAKVAKENAENNAAAITRIDETVASNIALTALRRCKLKNEGKGNVPDENVDAFLLWLSDTDVGSFAFLNGDTSIYYSGTSTGTEVYSTVGIASNGYLLFIKVDDGRYRAELNNSDYLFALAIEVDDIDFTDPVHPATGKWKLVTGGTYAEVDAGKVIYKVYENKRIPGDFGADYTNFTWFTFNKFTES